jgi:hypothetical protein
MTHYKMTYFRGPGNFGLPITVTLSTRGNGKVGVPGIIISHAELHPEDFRSDYPGASWFHAHRPGSTNLHAACGDCILGGTGTCYVQSSVQNGSQPAAALRDEEYPPMVRRALFNSGAIRSAIAGDMAAVPEAAFRSLQASLNEMAGREVRWLGYTHHPEVAPWLQDTHVVSCHTLEEREHWRGEGWRTFTALAPTAKLDLPASSFLCPASTEAGRVRGHKLECIQCMACTGVGMIDVDKPDGITVRHATKDTHARKFAVITKDGRVVGAGSRIEVPESSRERVAR